MKPTAAELIRAAPAYLGVPYSTLDCQAFVEAALRDIGISKNLAGSNAWYREVMKDGWVGTPEECKQKFGLIPPGAFLFILKDDGKEPEKYQGDGIGNVSHIGLYTDETAEQMLADCPKYQAMEKQEDRKAFEKKVCFGNGAIHSSSTRGCVSTSKFAGKSISGGWNRVGLWNKIDYGAELDQGGDVKMTATVWAPDGKTVNMRQSQSSKSPLVERVPIGTEVPILDETADWALIEYNGKQGWMMKVYLKIAGAADKPEDSTTVTVKRSELEAVYQQIGAMLAAK